MERAFILLLILFFSCCRQTLKKEKLQDAENNFQFPEINDTLIQQAEYFPPKSVSYAENKIEAFRPFCERLDSLGHDKLWVFYKDSSINRLTEKRYDGLQIVVDTNTTLSLFTSDFDGYNFTLNDTTSKCFKTYPCYIYNETDSIKWIYMQDGKIMAILEAFDSSYSWHPIQIWASSWCGNSYESIPLKKKNFLMFKIPVFNGPESVILRVKFYNRYAAYYSNQFSGRIDYRQFKLNKLMLDENKKLASNHSFLNF